MTLAASGDEPTIFAIASLAYIVGVLVLRAALTYSIQRSQRSRDEQ